MKTDPTTLALAEELHLDLDAILPEKLGFGTARQHKHKIQMLRALTPELTRMLGQGERVRYVSQGLRYNYFEYAFSGGGMASMLTNLYALVLTNRRLILIQYGQKVFGIGKTGALDLKLQVPLSAIKEVKGYFLNGLKLTLHDGTKLVFTQITRPNQKAFLEQLAAVRADLAPSADDATGLQHLCPSCLRVVAGVPGATPGCTHDDCGIPFRSGALAAKLSAFVPGIGDLYLRHYFFGSVEFFGSMLLLWVGVLLAVEAVGDNSQSILWFICGGLIVWPRIADYFVTRHMAKKGHVPLALRPTPDKRESLPMFPLWTKAMFALAVLSMLASAPLMLSMYEKKAATNAVIARVQAGEVDAALADWKTLTAGNKPSADDRGRLVLALYRAGEMSAGDVEIEALQTIGPNESLAHDINEEVEKLKSAFEQKGKGEALFLQGKTDEALAAFDASAAVLSKIKHPISPKSRDDLLLDLAIDELLVSEQGSGDAAKAAIDVVKDPALAKKRAAAVALLTPPKSPADDMRIISGIELATLDPYSQLRFYAHRARLAGVLGLKAEKEKIVATAAAIPDADLWPAGIEMRDQLKQGPAAAAPMQPAPDTHAPMPQPVKTKKAKKKK